MLDMMEFKHKTTENLTEIDGQMEKKSNIKDVCALLDMKSSKFFNTVNCYSRH